MQMNVAGLRRNIKNLAHNYSDAQVKVREATSNDPWGPSSTLMAEIADLTYNVVAFSEIMQMIWKRTNDHGKNWRHVYKALLLLEYLIKTGSEKVAQQCKENIFSIQTLKDFQHLEEGKDQGVHVREKAKQLVTLLKDDERLKAERARALKAKERFARTASGFGSDGSIDGPSRDRDTPVWPESDRRSVTNDVDFVRPTTVGEEELQLQLAIAMSKEEAEQEESKRRSDDVRLQLALSQSEQDFKKQGEKKESALVDLLDISFGATGISSPAQQDPWGMPSQQQASTRTMSNDIGWSTKPADPWLPPPPMSNGSSAASAFPLSSEQSLGARTKSPAGNSSSSIEGWLQNVPPPTSNAVPVLPAKPQSNSHELSDWSVKPDPWKQPSQQQQQQVPDPWNLKTSNDDPWAPIGDNKASGFPAPSSSGIRQTNSALGGLTPGSDLDEFDIITNRSKSAQQATSSPINDMLNRQNNNNLNDLLADMDPLNTKNKPVATKNNPAAFLGENSSLVNLDNLIKPMNQTSNNNAYNPFSDSPANKKNLFHQNQPQNPSMNQLKQQQQFQVASSLTQQQPQQDPWGLPVNNNDSNQQNTINNNNIGWMNPNQSNPFL
ncbi:hypothetical protein PVAND_008182 [Polypedilum vanderplanki]|uniref:ENTH domain-containing protein n=1 Tax=Polypedilum vanderplanki TaxID=319348 RepID=A0A9J6C9S3_POLVA|nr:hypothetical protein PVAND_008182 [Polypedilum vanderplanki]